MPEITVSSVSSSKWTLKDGSSRESLCRAAESLSRSLADGGSIFRSMTVSG